MKFSKGNSKIGKDTIIFNMTPAMKCPSDALGLCKIGDKCYAKKAEKQYHHVVPQYRRKQMVAWSIESANKISKDIREIVDRARNKISYVRFNESGDFKTQADINKLKRISKQNKDLVFYGYTCRKDLQYNKLPKNLVINGTNFMISNEYRPVPGRLLRATDNICPGVAHKYTGGCRGCMKCKEATGEVIYAPIH